MTKQIASDWTTRPRLSDLATGRVIQGAATCQTWAPRQHRTYSRAGQLYAGVQWPAGVIVTDTVKELRQVEVTYSDGRGLGALGAPVRVHAGARELVVSVFGRDHETTVFVREVGGLGSAGYIVEESAGVLSWQSTLVTIPAGLWLLEAESQAYNFALTAGILYQITAREAILTAGDL